MNEFMFMLQKPYFDGVELSESVGLRRQPTNRDNIKSSYAFLNASSKWNTLKFIIDETLFQFCINFLLQNNAQAQFALASDVRRLSKTIHCGDER